MNRTYKLACNFNTVEITDISYEDLLEVANFEEIGKAENGDRFAFVDEEELLTRLLQREYDIIAGVKTANVIGVGATPIKQAQAPAEPPSEKQINWARNLGMVAPERHSRQEVAAYIAKYSKNS
jgi:hypothetical protein